MTLNKLFLGDKSVVDIITNETVDEIKMKLAKRYHVTRLKPDSHFSGDHDNFNTVFVYHIKKDYVKIFFAKGLNKVRHSFQLNYPSFTGQVVDNGNCRLVKGKIGLPESIYYTAILWFSFFTFIYVGWAIEGEERFEGGEIALYFILFGLLTFLIMLVRTRKKLNEMREEIDRALSDVG